jgi:hypothetical protein
MRLAVVVPFLNEAEHLGRLLASIDAQERRPDELLLVDDGSRDESFAIASAFSDEHPYARALRRPPREDAGDRLARAAELVAFRWAVEQLSDQWDVVAKLDADLELPPITFGYLLDRLAEDPRLGLAGTFLTEDGPEGLHRITIPERHVHGATKFYRRACFEQIAPIPAILGWDTIDEATAQMHGWTTRSFALPGGDPLHLRPRGAYDGTLRAHRRWGECAYAFGEPLGVSVLLGLRQLADPPRVTGSINYVAGWLGAALRREPRAAADVRASVRRDQWARVRGRLRGRTP